MRRATIRLWSRRFKGRSDSQHTEIIEASTDDLQAGRQAVGRETRRDGQGGALRHVVERAGHVEPMEPALIVVSVEIAIVQLDRLRRERRCRTQKRVVAFEQTGEISPARIRRASSLAGV